MHFIKRHQKFIIFALVGSVGFWCDASVLFALMHAGVNVYIARLFSFACASLATWWLHRTVTFKNQKRFASSAKEFQHYFAILLISGCVNYLVFSLCVSWLPAVPLAPLAALTVSSLFALVMNYIGANYWVFRANKSY